MQKNGNEKTVQERQLTLMRVQTALLALILVILLAAGVFVAREISELQSVMDVIEQDVKALDMDAMNDAVSALTDAAKQFSFVDMDALNGAVRSLTEAADQLSSVDANTLNETVTALRDAAKMLSDVDMKGINKAVSSLTDAVNNLKDVDIDSLNALVQSLETVASKLQSAADAISGLFRR